MRKPTAAQMFALVRAARARGGAILGIRDGGSAAYGCITDATVAALQDHGWGRAAWYDETRRWHWTSFTINDAGRAVCREEADRQLAAERAQAEKDIALDDEGIG